MCISAGSTGPSKLRTEWSPDDVYRIKRVSAVREAFLGAALVLLVLLIPACITWTIVGCCSTHPVQAPTAVEPVETPESTDDEDLSIGDPLGLNPLYPLVSRECSGCRSKRKG